MKSPSLFLLKRLVGALPISATGQPNATIIRIRANIVYDFQRMIKLFLWV
jgi:hypothetical protein